MTYEAYYNIFIISLTISAVMLIIAMVLFFVLKIPNVIGDLSGSNARKAIDSIRNQSSSSGSAKRKTINSNKNKSRIVGGAINTGSLEKNSNRIGASYSTANVGIKNKVKIQYPEDIQPNYKNNNNQIQTTVLGNEYSNEQVQTTLLNYNNEKDSNETTILTNNYLNNQNETTVLTNNSNQYRYTGTSVLNENKYEVSNNIMSDNHIFNIEYEITYVNSNEIIG